MIATLDSSKLPASWYPLCRSSELRRGRVIPRTVAGVRLALFRTESGKVAAMISRCCHMGADLTNGKVQGEHLRCPLHHWEFGLDGQCVRIPACEGDAKAARQPAVTCREQYGMIFAWIGTAPTFELPGFADLVNPRLGRPHLFEFKANYLTAAINAFDQQHLRSVHHREVIGTPAITSDAPEHFRVEFRAKVVGDNLYDSMLRSIGKREVHIRIDCWGGNLLMMNHLGTPNNMMLVLLPVAEFETRLYAIPFIRRPENGVVDALTGTLLVKLLRMLTMVFVGQDFAVLRGMTVTLGKLLDGVDNTVMQWTQYWSALPPVDHPAWRHGASPTERG